MATSQSVVVTTSSVQSNAIPSTKVRVSSSASVFYAVGANPVAYSSGNCEILPANSVRYVNMEGNYNKIAFITASGSANVSVTAIGTVANTAIITQL